MQRLQAMKMSSAVASQLQVARGHEGHEDLKKGSEDEENTEDEEMEQEEYVDIENSEDEGEGEDMKMDVKSGENNIANPVNQTVEEVEKSKSEI